MLLFSFLGVLLYCVYEFIINSIYKMSNDELPDNTAADRCIMRKSSERKSAWRVEERQAISWSCQHTEECYSPIDRNRSVMISDIMGYQSYKPKFHLARHVTSRHDTTRSTCRAHAFCLCRACRTAWLDALDTSNVSCHVVTSQVEFGRPAEDGENCKLGQP